MFHRSKKVIWKHFIPNQPIPGDALLAAYWIHVFKCCKQDVQWFMRTNIT